MNKIAMSRIVSGDLSFDFREINTSVENRPGVYCLFNTKTRMAYIGSSKNCAQRLSGHMSKLRSGKNYNAGLQADYNASNGSVIPFVVQYTHFREVAYLLEAYWLISAGHENVYNIHSVWFTARVNCRYSGNHVGEAVDLSNEYGIRVVHDNSGNHDCAIRIKFDPHGDHEFYVV